MVPSSYSRFSTFSPEVSSTVTSTTTTVTSSSSRISSMVIGFSQSFISSTPSNISQPMSSQIYFLNPNASGSSSFPCGSIPLSTSEPVPVVSSIPLVSSTPGKDLEVQETQQQTLLQQMHQVPLHQMQQGPIPQQLQPLHQRQEVPVQLVQQVTSVHDVSRFRVSVFQKLPPTAQWQVSLSCKLAVESSLIE